MVRTRMEQIKRLSFSLLTILLTAVDFRPIHSRAVECRLIVAEDYRPRILPVPMFIHSFTTHGFDLSGSVKVRHRSLREFLRYSERSSTGISCDKLNGT